MNSSARRRLGTTFFCMMMIAATSAKPSMKLGESLPVTVTFYEEPGMYCSESAGSCGLGTDVTGNTNFVKNSLYPIHAASGNYRLLGGCNACGTLSFNGKSRSFVITNNTDEIDSIGGDAQHIDLCGADFSYFQSLERGGKLDFSQGGIFSGTWTHVACETLGSPDYPDGPGGQYVVRTQAYNQFAKATVVSRMHGVGEIKHIDYYTRTGGYYSGHLVTGWGAWWTPGADLSNQGGIGLIITLADDSVIDLKESYPLPDFSHWKTGDVYMVGP
jgi:hypothetical protein